MQKEMIIFTKTFDFTEWILRVTQHFHKSQRFVTTKRLLDAAFDVYENLVLANKYSDQQRFQYLQKADARQMLVRHYLRLSHRLGWLSDGQYHHGSELMIEIGRLLGGWIKQTRSRQR